jgi:hypothetical protein
MRSRIQKASNKSPKNNKVVIGEENNGKGLITLKVAPKKGNIDSFGRKAKLGLSFGFIDMNGSR